MSTVRSIESALHTLPAQTPSSGGQGEALGPAHEQPSSHQYHHDLAYTLLQLADALNPSPLLPAAYVPAANGAVAWLKQQITKLTHGHDVPAASSGSPGTGLAMSPSLGKVSAVLALADGLRMGSRGEQVMALQKALGVEADGRFGPKTQRALQMFKMASGAQAQVGALSQQYESGGRGVATISTGVDDAGGVSYGAHQLASATGTMGKFIASPENAAYAKSFEGLRPGTAAFNTAYRQVAAQDPVGFAAAQKNFITRTHYDAVQAHAKALGFDVSDRGVQEALYSQSVQHGRAGNFEILDNAAVGLKDVSKTTPADQIKAIYKERGDYASQFASDSATRGRYAREMQQALQISGYHQTYYRQP